MGVVVGRPRISGQGGLPFKVPLVEGQVMSVLVTGGGRLGIKEEEILFPFLLSIAVEGEGVDAGFVNGVIETQAFERGFGDP